jgi:hypothetical protein
MTAVTFQQVRDRLSKSGLQLELHVEPDGYRWDIANEPVATRRVFPTVRAALEHADMYTQVWYSDSDHVAQPLPAGQPERALTPPARPIDPAGREHMRRRDPSSSRLKKTRAHA